MYLVRLYGNNVPFYLFTVGCRYGLLRLWELKVMLSDLNSLP